MELSFEPALIDVWRQALLGNAKTVLLGSERYPARRTPQARAAASGLCVRRERDSKAGTEPAENVPAGGNGAIWKESNAVPQRGTLCGERGRWKGDSIRRTDVNAALRLVQLV